MTEPRAPYDPVLGTITQQDKEYAVNIIDDLVEAGCKMHTGQEVVMTLATWLRKARYEAVMHERATKDKDHSR